MVTGLLHAGRARESQGDGIIDGYDNYTSSDVALQTALLVWGITLAATVVFAVVIYLLTAIPLAALFRKTGVESWKAWVPFYSTYTWLRLGGQNGRWVWLALVPYGSTVTGILLYIGMYRTGKAFAKETGFLILGILLPWVWLFILGFGRDQYRPELIAAAGLPGPLEGHGAPAAADGITVPLHYGAAVYPPPAPPAPPTAFPSEPTPGP